MTKSTFFFYVVGRQFVTWRGVDWGGGGLWILGKGPVPKNASVRGKALYCRKPRTKPDTGGSLGKSLVFEEAQRNPDTG